MRKSFPFQLFEFQIFEVASLLELFFFPPRRVRIFSRRAYVSPFVRHVLFFFSLLLPYIESGDVLVTFPFSFHVPPSPDHFFFLGSLFLRRFRELPTLFFFLFTTFFLDDWPSRLKGTLFPSNTFPTDGPDPGFPPTKRSPPRPPPLADFFQVSFQ